MSRDLKLITLALFLWGSGEGLFYYILPLYMQQLGAAPHCLLVHPRRPAGRSL